jgi:hypothetical protein
MTQLRLFPLDISIPPTLCAFCRRSFLLGVFFSFWGRGVINLSTFLSVSVCASSIAMYLTSSTMADEQPKLALQQMQMSALSPPPFHPAHPRSQSRASVAASDTTYHSFHDVDLHEPPVASSPPTGNSYYAQTKGHTEDFTSTEMQRQDSGYESLKRRLSQSSRRRTSSTSSSSAPRPRTRPSIRRAAKSSPNPQRSSGQSLYMVRSHQPQAAHTSYFHFPSPDPVELSAVGPSGPERCESPFQMPPQTTHYWTSDRTRRLEYAAIDAASRGVKGWVMRHLVPDCFVPREAKHLTFEDDRGSVRRYRLELEDGDDRPEKTQSRKGAHSRRKAWLSWGRRATA